MGIRSFFYWLSGRRCLYQFYANITYSTSHLCLEWHGRIIYSKEQLPEQLGCDYHLFEFSVWELSQYREKERIMRGVAREEMNRRDYFQQGKKALDEKKFEEGIDFFRQSADIDVFLTEIERLVENYKNKVDREIWGELKQIFLRGYREKFAKKRYERQPERMRMRREKLGLKKIKNLFS